jgi:predicted restriction endonuclease
MESIVLLKHTIYKKYIDTKDKYDEETVYKVIDFINTIFEEYKYSSFLNMVHSLINEYFDIEYDIIDDLNYKKTEQKKISREDTFFKLKVWERDQNCILCDSNSGECDEIVYEVAHIYNFAECETDTERYDPYNGILLCANMHKRFDKNKLDFVVNENTVNAIFCEDMKNSSIYKKYNGKEMTNFNKGNLYYLEKRKGIKRN